jgi:nicotinate phosphoribosyltransferase
MFPSEPLLRVEGRRIMCQIIETFLLSEINFQTLIASKATRLVQAARGRPVVDFGLRRAHGGEAGTLAARAAYIGGVEATATVSAGYLWGIPTTGTMAHSYVRGFASEVEAFECFLRTHPRQPSLLIDTYDPLHGARHAVEAADRSGIRPVGVRIDSGEAAELAGEVRALLDAGGYPDTRVIVSGDLTETTIERLVASGAPIDGFGVGTDLVTSSDAPALSGVYKLVESDGRPVMKIAGEKSTLPGRHQVFREDVGDVIGLACEDLPGRPLLEPVLRGGERVMPTPPLSAARDRAARELARLPADVRAFTDPVVPEPRLSPRLLALKESLDVAHA